MDQNKAIKYFSPNKHMHDTANRSVRYSYVRHAYSACLCKQVAHPAHFSSHPERLVGAAADVIQAAQWMVSRFGC